MHRKLIVGLGNPGTKYQSTRHNVGFIFVEELAENLGLTFKLNKKTNALVADGNDFILAKPQTYMNKSGEAVHGLLNYYNCDLSNLLIVHDDVDIEANKSKTQVGSGAAGHHGVESIIKSLGTKEFERLRIGIGRPDANQFEVKEYVLGRLNESQQQHIKALATQFTNMY